jgi:hypothetical protein
MSAMLHGAVLVSAHICAHHQNAPGAAWPHNGARTLRCRGLGVRAWDGGRHLIGDIIWVLLCFEHGDHRPTALRFLKLRWVLIVVAVVDRLCLSAALPQHHDNTARLLQVRWRTSRNGADWQAPTTGLGRAGLQYGERAVAAQGHRYERLNPGARTTQSAAPATQCRPRMLSKVDVETWAHSPGDGR